MACEYVGSSLLYQSTCSSTLQSKIDPREIRTSEEEEEEEALLLHNPRPTFSPVYFLQGFLPLFLTGLCVGVSAQPGRFGS